MAIPSPLYYACFPLQEYFVDKDTGFPLAAGQVFFYEDTNRSVLKNIYQQEQQPNGEYQFALLPNPLTLSSVGTFQDNSGNDIIPFLYPFTGLPAAPTGILDLYFIEVYSSQGVLQFTREAWPPNSYGTSPASSQSELSQNILTNTQFSSISYIPDPTTGSLTFNASPAATSVEFAPGWEIVTTGTGTVVITQIPLNASIISEAPYAIEIASAGAGLTSVQLRQRIPESPRILYGNYVSGLFLISNQNLASVAVQMSYVPSTGAQYVIAQGVTSNDASFIPILGVNDLSVILNGAVNTDAPPAGYVDIYIDFPVLSTVQITSTQIVQVQNAETFANFVQLSVPQQTNSTFYYYKPQLENKPIPSYTLGWNFGQNPCQILGTAVGVSGLGNNTARYIADQTIAFESVGNALSYTFTPESGITVATTAASQFALIQYLDEKLVRELLTGRMAVKISGNASTAINANISLWYTTNAALPGVPISTNNTTFFSTLTLGVPTTIAAGWTEIARSNLGAASFSLSPGQTEYNFNGWFDNANATTATYFAIVIGFNQLAAIDTASIQYCTLARGDIATPPPALNEWETLSSLQYYYQTSYPPGIALGAASPPSAIFLPMIGQNPGGPGGTKAYPLTFNQAYDLKRTIPIFTFYNELTGAINGINMTTVVAGISAAQANAPAQTDGTGIYWQTQISVKSILMESINSVGFAAVGGTAVPFGAYASYNYTADARLGQV
jgi:hypothetical protein